jgi:hypothetical protein
MKPSRTKRLRIPLFLITIPAALLASGVFSACAGLLPPSLSTPLPPEFIPTAAALTLAARSADLTEPGYTQALSGPANSSTPWTIQISSTPAIAGPGQTPTPEPVLGSAQAAPETNVSQTTVPEIGGTPAAIESAAPAPPPSATPPRDGASGRPTFTPAPAIPDARIQIYRLGELSKIISPLEVSLRLSCGDAKLVRIELHGEDGRLLARYVREYKETGWDSTRIGISMDFEISAAAELGRLVISAEDTFGRVIESNSMNLILLSQGMTELNPASGLQQQIIIQDPGELALIQNGHLIVSGRAHPKFDRPLRVMLVAEDGRVLGQRLAGVNISVPGDYGAYIAEVPYEVQEITPALLVVYEEGSPISEVTYLTSLKVILAP